MRGRVLQYVCAGGNLLAFKACHKHMAQLTWSVTSAEKLLNMTKMTVIEAFRLELIPSEQTSRVIQTRQETSKNRFSIYCLFSLF